jgi:hypothetical protein
MLLLLLLLLLAAPAAIPQVHFQPGGVPQQRPQQHRRHHGFSDHCC